MSDIMCWVVFLGGFWKDQIQAWLPTALPHIPHMQWLPKDMAVTVMYSSL